MTILGAHDLPGRIKPRSVVLEADWKPRSGYLPSPLEERTHRTYFGARVWHKPRLTTKEVELDEPGPKEVLVKIKATGICGSDVHMVQQDKDGYMLYPGLTRLPVIPGHELSGEVVSVGHEVKTLRPGNMITCEEMWWCGECDACRTDNLNQCQNLEEMGFTRNGGFAEYLVVNHKYCWKVDELENRYKNEEEVYEAAAMTEPTAVAYNAIFNRAGGFKPGAFVVVWGAGPIGLASLALAKAAGASMVTVFETSSIRREMAKNMGADFVFDPKELDKQGIAPHEKILDVTGGSGADFIVEAAGAPELTLPQISKALAIGAKVAWIGRANVEAPIFVELFQTRASQLYGSQGHSGHGTFMNVIRLMASGSIDMRKMVTARISLDDIPRYVEKLMRKEEVKVLVKP
jgi:threonine dehydrogenase-like Zn-dependent dehydrogenase